MNPFHIINKMPIWLGLLQFYMYKGIERNHTMRQELTSLPLHRVTVKTNETFCDVPVSIKAFTSIYIKFNPNNHWLLLAL